MERVVIVGGSIAGLTLALALAERDIDTVVFEQDPIAAEPALGDGVHGPAFRRSTPQDRHSHVLMPLGRNLLATRLPDVLSCLDDNGAVQVRILDHMPTTIDDGVARPGDDELVGVACRRTVFEWCLRAVASEHPRVDVRTGVRVDGLMTEPTASPTRLTGVVADGARLDADVVVDAGGRNSPIPRWLADMDVALPEAVSEPCEVVYFTRFYRLRQDRLLPLNRGLAAGGFGPASASVCFLADNHTTSVTVGVLPGDAVARTLIKPDGFTVAARLHPLVAPWVDESYAEPITDVFTMARLNNGMRRLASASDGAPCVHGLVAVGDATCTTNPAFGRGLSLAIAHAFGVADVIDAHGGDGDKLATEADRVADEVLQPWFDDSCAQDRARAALWRDEPPPPPLPGRDLGRVMRAAPLDPDVWRAAMRRFMLLDPPGAVFDDAAVMTKVEALAPEQPPPGPSPFGPTRDELVAALS